MRKVNAGIGSALVIAAVMFTGCSSLNKMKKNAEDIKYNVTPEVLETHAGQVKVDVNGRIPENYFGKKVTLVATPVMTYEGGEKALKPVSLQGEKVEGNNKTISYVDGGSFSTQLVFPFEEGMRNSDLVVRISASQGTKTVDFEPYKLADGVLATSTLVDVNPMSISGVQKTEKDEALVIAGEDGTITRDYDAANDAFQRVYDETFMADIHYLINSSYVRGSEMKADDVKALKEYAAKSNEAENIDVKNLEISAYASPDGEQDWNEKLSKQRKKTSESYLARQMKRAKVNAEILSKYTAEDWEGFKELMEKSDIQDKELILRVLSMYSDPEVREREIRNLSEAFTAVAEDILPKLRRAKLSAMVSVTGRSDEEIAELASSNPAELTEAELLYAATLTEDLNKQLSIYNTFTKQFPNDWRGFNNVGVVLVEKGKIAEAEKAFAKAEKLNSNATVNNNLGVVALLQGDVAKAETYFGAASGAGEEVKYNKGIVAIKKAEYKNAVSYLSNCSCENGALAQILAGDNNAALKTLKSVEQPSALAEYLKAVIGARSGKEALVFSSLEKAIKLDAAYKDLAATDLEFAKYFEDAKFTSIVK